MTEVVANLPKVLERPRFKAVAGSWISAVHDSVIKLNFLVVNLELLFAAAKQPFKFGISFEPAHLLLGAECGTVCEGGEPLHARPEKKVGRLLREEPRPVLRRL